MGFNNKQLEYWTLKIYQKQNIDGFGGFYCNYCGAIPSSLKKQGFDPNLMADHIDNIPGHDTIENLQFICRGCNKRKNPKRDSIAGRVLTQSEYTNKQEQPWIEWVMQKVIYNAGYPVKQAIFSGAQVFKISPDTISRRWLEKLVSDEGPLDGDKLNDVGERILTLKSKESKTETEKKREMQAKMSLEHEDEALVRGGHFFSQ